MFCYVWILSTLGGVDGSLTCGADIEFIEIRCLGVWLIYRWWTFLIGVTQDVFKVSTNYCLFCSVMKIPTTSTTPPPGHDSISVCVHNTPIIYLPILMSWCESGYIIDGCLFDSQNFVGKDSGGYVLWPIRVTSDFMVPLIYH